jgi:hypothetical protein
MPDTDPISNKQIQELAPSNNISNSWTKSSFRDCGGDRVEYN